MLDMLQEELETHQGDERERELSMITGKLMYPFLGEMIKDINEKYPKVQVHLYGIRNDFFGEQITVAGLLTAQDIIAQVKDKPLGERLLLPDCMLRSGESVFLDDVTVEEMENALQVKIDIVKSSGQDFVEKVIE